MGASCCAERDPQSVPKVISFPSISPFPLPAGAYLPAAGLMVSCLFHNFRREDVLRD